MALAVERVVPILRIFDETRAREFYVGYLGCVVDWSTGSGKLVLQQ
jgi:hypothetical protein